MKKYNSIKDLIKNWKILTTEQKENLANKFNDSIMEEQKNG